MSTPLPSDVLAWHAAQSPDTQAICDRLAEVIASVLPDAEPRVWHRHPVWFFDDNPIVGYSKFKTCVRLLFWSGQSFDAPGLTPQGTFKAAEARYTSVADVDEAALRLWLADARTIQWDDKNIVRRKGRLERLV